ncbi:hypothetical protein [Streptomyces sp. FIT100]|uniref:hypothetical protein n=1 Tax=Streptomyces sp. FIT100 TaxID=2837956 RepID=UPI0021C7ED02|nr:hypothetical protein [Streptomyces sp. FIT100]UUN29002.1 hypothetical protein KK483_23425 [Streptomyces sp. FIT100]
MQGSTGVQGPQGFQGDQAALVGYINIDQTPAANESSVECEEGDLATGGGFDPATDSTVDYDGPIPAVQGAEPTGWQVTSESANVLTAYVVCLDRTP